MPSITRTLYISDLQHRINFLKSSTITYYNTYTLLINTIDYTWQFKTITPDFGAPSFVPQWGATITGARNFLIAYNVNMLSTKEQARRVALNIRTQGRGEDQVRTGMQY